MKQSILSILFTITVLFTFSANAQVVPLSEEELEYELLDFQIGDSFVLGESIEVFRYGEEFLLPFELVIQLLEVNLNLNSARMTVNGIVNGNDVNINLRDIDTDRTYVSNIDGIHYISSNTLAKILSSEIDIDFRRLLATFKASFQYPIEIRLDRESRDIVEVQNRQAINYENIFEDQYHLFTAPKGYINLKYDANNVSSDYASSMQIYGDALYHSARLNINKNAGSDTIAAMAFSRSQTHPNKKILGLLNNYSFGDVASVNNQAGASFSGLGIVFSSFDNRYDNYYGKVTIREFGPADWQVELYKNGYLINIGQVPGNGEILFEDIDVDYGLNRFQLKFYGPFGEIKTEEKEIIVGQASLRPGEISLSGGVVDTSQSLLNGSSGQDSTPAIIVQSKIGVSISTSLGLSFVSEKQTDRIAELTGKDYKNESILSVNHIFPNAFLDASAFYKTEEQFKFKSVLLGSLGRFTRYNFEYGYENNYDLESPDTQQNYQESLYQTNFSTRFNKLLLSLSARRLQVDYDTYSVTQDRTNLGTSFRFNRFTLTNTMVYSSLQGTQANTNSARVVDNLAITTSLANSVNFRMSTDFLLYDNSGEEAQFQAVDASINWRLSPKVSMNNLIRYDRNDNYQLQTNVSWQHDKFNLIGFGQVLNDNKWSVGIGVSFNLDYDYHNDRVNMAGLYSNRTATLDAFNYIDNNGNNRYDEFDEPLHNVSIVTNQATNPVMSDRQGFAYVPTLPSGRPAKVHFDTVQARRTNLKAKIKNSTYFSHAGGVIRQDVPFTYFADVDGTIVDNSSIGAAKLVPIELYAQSGKLVKRAVTDLSNNYFFFSEVNAGRYVLKVADSYLKDKKLQSVPATVEININGATEYFEVPEITLIDDSTNSQNSVLSETISSVQSSTLSTALFDERQFFTVQFGAYNDKEYCALRVEQLKAAGIEDAFYSMASTSCKVLAGEFKDENVAEQYRKSLPANLLLDGFTTVYKLGDDLFSIQIAAFSIQLSALTKTQECTTDLFERYKNIELQTYVLDTGGYCKLYIGDFVSKVNAVESLNQLPENIKQGAFIVKR